MKVMEWTTYPARLNLASATGDFGLIFANVGHDTRLLVCDPHFLNEDLEKARMLGTEESGGDFLRGESLLQSSEEFEGRWD